MTHPVFSPINTLDLTGKIALVTGASKGIGAAAAMRLAQAGAHVVLAARNKQALDELAQKMPGGKEAHITQSCDVAVWDDLKQTVAQAKKRFGSIDILVNNAGVIDPIARLAEADPNDWGRVVDINLKGVFHGMRAVIPDMIEAGGGVIINISSGAATSPLEGWSHYCATKAAVLMLTRNAHKEYADAGVRVVGLSPGTVATDMQREIKASGINPVSQLDFSTHIPPEWVGETIIYLCSDAGRAFDGGDFSMKTNEGRLAVGLPPIN